MIKIMQAAAVKRGRIETLIRRQVIHSLREILTDPDFGLELKPAAVRRLKKSSESYDKGLYKSIDQVLAKFQLK